MKSSLRKKLQVLAITGSFASGKTTCARMFKELGASVIDADKIYHELIRPGASLHKKIVAAIGRGILKKNKQINRKELGKIVFNDSRSLKKLSQLAHPVIVKKMKVELSRLKKSTRCKMAVIDAPLLIEAGLLKMADKLAVIKTSKKNQISRAKRQWGISAAETAKRIELQLPLKEKIKLADYVIDNNGTLRNTKRQVENIWREIQNENR